MNEKLLSKPPFRYLHDVFTATLAKTGFGEGLYNGEELNSKSFEDKDAKLAWLVKAITLTELVVEEQIDIKPSMVLAGQQPEKTNLWLQQMFRAATAGVDTTPYVNKILGVGGDEDEDGPAPQDEGDDDQAAAEEEAARQQAEAEAAMQEEQARQAQEKKKADKKKRAKQAEEEERQRQAYEE